MDFSLADSTVRTYATRLAQYAVARGITVDEAVTADDPDRELAAYISEHLFEPWFSASAATQTALAVRRAQLVRHGIRHEPGPLIQMALKAARTAHPPRKRQAPAIQPTELAALRSAAHSAVERQVMIIMSATIQSGHRAHAFLPSGPHKVDELPHLALRLVVPRPDSDERKLVVHITRPRRPKTSSSRPSFKLYCECVTATRTWCPAHAFRSLWRLRTKAELRAGNRHPMDAPLFITPQGRPLTKSTFASTLRELCARAGANPDITGHSGRVTYASFSHRAGLDHADIVAGHWASYKTAQDYIRFEDDVQRNAVRQRSALLNRR